MREWILLYSNVLGISVFEEIRKIFASSRGVRAFESKILLVLTLLIASDETDLDVEGVECTLEGA